jgi:hypothetical protein
MKLVLFNVFLFIFSCATIHAQNQLVSEGNFFEGEPYLVMNPTNNQHLVAAWMGFQFNNKVVIKSSVSTDGETLGPHQFGKRTLSQPFQVRMYRSLMII